MAVLSEAPTLEELRETVRDLEREVRSVGPYNARIFCSALADLTARVNRINADAEAYEKVLAHDKLVLEVRLENSEAHVSKLQAEIAELKQHIAKLEDDLSFARQSDQTHRWFTGELMKQIEELEQHARNATQH